MGSLWSGESKITKIVIDIENEAKEIETLIHAAKIGRWQKVWDILGSPSNPRKGYLINVIPQSRRWGLLHQVVYWNDHNILQKLLKFKACDLQIKTKSGISECGETSRMTPLEIANAYGYKAISSILSNHIKNNVCEPMTYPTFQPADGYSDSKGLLLLSLTLAAYKPAFHPAPVDQNKSVSMLLLDIFTDICRCDSRWKKVQEVVADSVYAVSSEIAEVIKSCVNRIVFFQQIMRLYSDDSNCIHTYVNMAFRRQKEEEYSPSGDDLAIGPFCVMYQMLLLYWSELKTNSEETYKKMRASKSDADKYTTRTRFVWQYIVSSSANKEHVCAFPTKGSTRDTTIIFTIDNSTSCMYQPRCIEILDMVDERIYPAGATFLVTGTKEIDGEVHVNLKLLAK